MLELGCQLVNSRGQGINNPADLFAAHREGGHDHQDVAERPEPDPLLQSMLADDRPGLALGRQRTAVRCLFHQFDRGDHPALSYVRDQRVVTQRMQAAFQVLDRGGQMLQGLFLLEDVQAGQCGKMLIQTLLNVEISDSEDC